MSNVALNTPTTHLGGCGGPASPGVAPAAGVTAGAKGGGFAIPAGPIPNLAPERFANSAAGGVILGADGVPAGRIPAGSFVDTRNGSIYAPDGTAFALPEGATADFFDLPDIKDLVAANRAAAPAATTTAGGHTTVGSKGAGPDAKGGTGDSHHGSTQSFVDGQWGPGGVTPIKGGASSGCDMDHGPATKAGGSSGAPGTTAAATSTTGAGATTAVAGVSGGTLDALTASINAVMEQVRRITPTPTSGGGATLAAVTGAGALGSTDALRSSVNDLVAAIAQLNKTLQDAGIRGGGPVQAPIQLPPLPTAPPVEPPKTEAPKVEPPRTEAPKTDAPKVEPPKTEAPKSDSASSSDTTATTASGSSSS